MKQTKAPSRFQGFQLLLVQSSVCVLAVLLMLLLRVIGVDVYNDLATRFQEAMTDTVLVSAAATTTNAQIPSVTSTVTTTVPEVTEAQTQAVVFYPPLIGGTLTSSFGEREDPFGNNIVVPHEGMDVAAEEGTPLAALADGYVSTVAFEEGGFGWYVVVTCDTGQRYLYAHCSAIYAEEGAQVRAGDLLAAVGNTGASTGNHVHIEWIREDGVKCDPSAVVPRETYV